MSLLFTEGFDSYPNPIPLWYKWNRNTTAPRVTGRSPGGYGIQINTSDFIAKTVDLNTNLIVGFAIRPTNTGLSTFYMIEIYNQFDQSVVKVGLDNFTTVFIEDFNGVIDNTTFNLPLNQWSYIEVKVSNPVDNAPAGAVKVRGSVNALVLTFYSSPAGRDFNDVGQSQICTFGFNGDGDQQYDDVYVADNTGLKNNDFLGAIRIKTLVPTANGDTIQLTPVGAGTNYQAVNNPVLTPDATYVESRIIGEKDLYYSSGLVIDPNNSIAGVVVNAVVRKDKSGYGNVGIPVKYGTTDSEGCPYFVPSGYQSFQRHLDVNPVTMLPWTQSQVNNFQAGVQIGGCPEPPEDVQVIFGHNMATIAWNPPSTGPTPDCYTIYRSDTVGGVGTPIASCIQGDQFLETVTGRSYVDTTVTDGNTYYYYVVSVLGDCCTSNTGGPGTSPSTSINIIPGLMQIIKSVLVDEHFSGEFIEGGFYITKTCYYPIQTDIFGDWNQGEGSNGNSVQHFDIALNWVQDDNINSAPIGIANVAILNQLAIPYNYFGARWHTTNTVKRWDFIDASVDTGDDVALSTPIMDMVRKPATGNGGHLYAMYWNIGLSEIWLYKINALTSAMSIDSLVNTGIISATPAQMKLGIGWIYIIDQTVLYQITENTMLLNDQTTPLAGKTYAAVEFDNDSNVVFTLEHNGGADIEIARWNGNTLIEINRVDFTAAAGGRFPGIRGLTYWLGKLYVRFTNGGPGVNDIVYQLNANTLTILQSITIPYNNSFPTFYGGTFNGSSSYQEVHINPLNLGYVLGRRAEGQTFPNLNTLVQFTL